MLKIGILAGEPSGDLIGSELIRAIKTKYPDSVFAGIAGPKMVAEGCQAIFTIDALSVMGVVEVLQKLPHLISVRRKIKRYLRQYLPDIVIGIDCPDFNLPVEAYLKKHHIPTVHYNSPTIWAWRKNRIKNIKHAVSCMLTLFPFETPLYEQAHIPVKFIGHPLADSIPETIQVTEIRKQLGIDPQAKVIALLPGSRTSEIKHLGPLFLATAAWCLERNPQLKFIVPMVNEARHAEFQAQCANLPKDFPLQLFIANTQTVIAAADVVLVASGTATLETALLKKPMVVAYRFHRINYWIAKLLIDVPYFALPNILLNQPCVPEFFQEEATKERLGTALLAELYLPKNAQLFEKLHQIRQILRHSASEKAADAIIELALCGKKGISKTYL
jgi:lipid-A-disaccharide synthase